jgi:hypothetical protein
VCVGGGGGVMCLLLAILRVHLRHGRGLGCSSAVEPGVAGVANTIRPLQGFVALAFWATLHTQERLSGRTLVGATAGAFGCAQCSQWAIA